MKEMVGGCCVCSDERGWPDNALVYCDGNGCTVAVHQACYGIVTVPTGPWYCRKCEITDRTQKVRCSLCPSRSGALKRADTGGWAHVVCALYIPEVRFGNVTSMEPIILQLIPPERYNKTCYICQEAGKLRRAVAGACMQCNKSGCKQQFHVTCAQGLGLLCEEAGNYLDNVKYCGYCQHHYGKLKKGSNNVKTPYKPIHDSQSSDSSGEREEGACSPGPAPAPAPTPADNLPPTRKSRKSSNSATTSAKTTPSTSRASSAASTAPLPGKVHHSGEKSGKKSSPVGEGSRRSSVASEPSPAHAPANEPGAPASDAQHSLAHDLAPAAPSNIKAASNHSLSSEQTSPNVSEASVVTISLSEDITPTYSVEVPPLPAAAPPTVISSTEYLENKHTKKRKAVSQSQAAPLVADYLPPPPAAAAVALLNPPAQYTEVPMDIDATDKVKKAKTDSPVIVSPATHQPSPGQMGSPGQRTRTSSAGSLANIRSPSRAPGGKAGGGGGGGGGGGEREAPPPPSLLVSVPLPSTSHDLSFVAPGQVAGTSAETAPTAHNFYQLQKQAQAQAAHTQAAAAATTSRLSWGGLSVYEMQQQEPVALNKTAEKRPEVPPMPAPVRNKKRAAMNSAVLAHANTTTPAIQLSPGALVSNASKMPPLPPLPPPPPPPSQHYQDSPSNSPGAERSRPISAEQQQRINAANTLAPHMLGNEINLNSSAAECLSEQLSAELAAHAVGPRAPSPPLLPPPMLSRHLAGARSSASASSGGTQTLEQLLERQWEQGSQYIMERAKNFDIASLLSCLHQLRTENVRLEEQVGTLMQRKETLLAVNARLANPLSAGTAPSPESGRCSRDNSRPPSVMRTETMSADRSPQIMMQQKPS